MPVDDMREQMEVNVIGQVAVTQAFLDALRAGRGRIVNVGSISGLQPGGVRTPPLSETSRGFEQIFRDGPPELRKGMAP